jgi:hypothetical protein
MIFLFCECWKSSFYVSKVLFIAGFLYDLEFFLPPLPMLYFLLNTIYLDVELGVRARFISLSLNFLYSEVLS